MEVEVVLGEVREHPAGEADSGHAAQLERVRGDLHRAGHVAAVHHAAEGLLQVDRLGRRALDLLLDSRHHALDRAEQPALPPRGLEQMANQEGRGRLAVRAGHADERELRRRVAVEARGGRTHGGADVVHQHLGHPKTQRPLADERHGAPLDRVRSEVVAVRPEPGHAKKERPRGDALARVGESRNLDLGRPITHQIPQGHGALAGYSGPPPTPAGSSGTEGRTP